MNNKKMMAGLLTAGLLLVPNAALAESTDVNLIVNDTHVVSSEAEGQVYINDAGRTMIPLRLVSETMGYVTNWQPDGSIQITSADGAVDVTLQIGSTAYTASGEAEKRPRLSASARFHRALRQHLLGWRHPHGVD